MTEVVLATLAFYLLQLMLPNLIAVARGEIDAASLFGVRDEKIENRLSFGVPTALPSIYKRV